MTGPAEDEYQDELSDAQSTRRSLFKSTLLGVAAAGLATVIPNVATAEARVNALTAHAMQPLPFSANQLDGLSARLIESHWSNNYGGSVKTLNAVNTMLAQALSDANTPPFAYNALKREHLMRTGSVVLHELYFENLGGDGKADTDTRARIGSAFGDYSTWEDEFRRIAMGLGGGSGWVVFGYNTHFGALENYWLADHMHFPASTVPLLVLDMYEHSYQMDYGAATARYVDAFFKNIQWDIVAARAARAGASGG